MQPTSGMTQRWSQNFDMNRSTLSSFWLGKVRVFTAFKWKPDQCYMECVYFSLQYHDAFFKHADAVVNCTNSHSVTSLFSRCFFVEGNTVEWKCWCLTTESLKVRKWKTQDVSTVVSCCQLLPPSPCQKYISTSCLLSKSQTNCLQFMKYVKPLLLTTLWIFITSTSYEATAKSLHE